MSKLILITGGCRSGKSSFGLKRGEEISEKRLFVATCPLLDEEMKSRIRQHKKDREKRNWETVEEPLHFNKIHGKISRFDVVLVDCLTLWISNFMFECERKGIRKNIEAFIYNYLNNFIKSCETIHNTIIFINNEVGMGIVPNNHRARLFRDITGRCSQLIAAQAEEVVLMSCGLPLYLKKNN